jgi:hypothetical protein
MALCTQGDETLMSGSRARRPAAIRDAATAITYPGQEPEPPPSRGEGCSRLKAFFAVLCLILPCESRWTVAYYAYPSAM